MNLRDSDLANPRAGWYPDPEDLNRQRFWDGSAWTRETRDIPTVSSQYAQPSRSAASAPPSPPLCAPTRDARRERSGTVALVLGIIAFLTGWIPALGAIIGLTALVVAIVARRRGQRTGKWATALVLASLATIASVLMTVAFSNYVASRPTASEKGIALESSREPSAVAPSAASPKKANDESEQDDIREYWALARDLRMPQFVGMNLADAVKQAERLRLTLRYEDDLNERTVWVPSNWTVVSQDVAPATDSREGSWVEVRALKHDEVTDEVDKTLAYDLHLGEKVFTGTITGYEREMTIDVSTVIVDAAPVSLDLISPLAPLCGSPLKDGLASAAAELEKQLPIGQRVLVVMSRPGESDGFIHILGTDGRPASQPPADSVNERLIRTGWWVPDAAQMEGGVGLEAWGGDPVAFTPYAPRYPAESQAIEYVSHIAQAGDQAVTKYVGTVGDCRRAVEADADAYADRWKEAEREREKATADIEARIRSGYYYCRDGDGDGVCYEH